MTTEDLARNMEDIQGRYQQGELDLGQLIKLAVDLGRMYERELNTKSQ